MLTSDQVRADAAAAAPVINNAATIASGLLPEYAALIRLGALAAQAAPDLFADMLQIHEAAEPTPEQEAALRAKLEALKTI